jgi:Adenine-specific DNA methylase containing a Zn-ribbon
MQNYPKRLIEVDLPIKRISAHARLEKSRGTISLLHIWWARRPLAACRAVTCAALWIDPADPLCPQVFRDIAMRVLLDFAKKAVSDKTLGEHCSADNWAKWNALVKQETTLDSKNENHLNVLRFALLDFIADFANWDNSTVKEYLETSRALTQAAHEALGGEKGTRPLVVDPFAGGGSIPLEALRVGADVFASDLNPVAVLLNKVVLEYLPKFGTTLVDATKKWGEWIKEHAKKELLEYYPDDEDGSTPIAYLWARTIKCEGPGCGAEVPLIKSLWLAKKDKKQIALQLIPKNDKKIEFEIIEKELNNWKNSKKHSVFEPKFEGTVKRGSATCPCCGFTTPVGSVRKQMHTRLGGATDARMFCVVFTKKHERGRFYRLPTEKDIRVVELAENKLAFLKAKHTGTFSLIPNEHTPGNEGHRAVASVTIYGMTRWEHIFTPRQSLLLASLIDLVNKIKHTSENGSQDELLLATVTLISFVIDREAEHSTSLCRWNSSGEKMQATFGRQAIPMMWDFCETNPLGKSVGSLDSLLGCILAPLNDFANIKGHGQVELVSATQHPLPNDSCQAVITDPPYYDAVPYADLADFFYVWLKRSLSLIHPQLFKENLTPKKEQAIVWHPGSEEEKKSFENKMGQALLQCKRILTPNGIGIIVFAHKSTRGWEAQLQAMVDAGWVITASWPVDTEMGTRMNAMGTASLASSIHLVCRPRENPDGSVSETDVGDWRDVLQELPKRIHDWMPRLSQEGVVGADAIFACLGPALEIFSRYSKVEKASGESVSLKEYLEHVWAVVAKEALDMVFAGAQTSDFEEDARLTAMWLWTLSAGADDIGKPDKIEDVSGDEEESGSSKKLVGGFVLEFDAARKIAQGLGAHLEQLQNLIESKGETARLLPVSERARYLFGKDAVETPKKKKKKSEQTSMFAELGIEEEGGSGFDLHSSGKIGITVLDRLHQSMILFATGRSEALKRFIVEDGVGQDQRFWRLAQAFSALYPASCEEKRWVDGVLARKKGLGF